MITCFIFSFLYLSSFCSIELSFFLSIFNLSIFFILSSFQSSLIILSIFIFQCCYSTSTGRSFNIFVAHNSFNFFLCLPPGFLPVVGPTKRWRSPYTWRSPARLSPAIALGQALICGCVQSWSPYIVTNALVLRRYQLNIFPLKI